MIASQVRTLLQGHRSAACDLLMKLVALPSLPGDEDHAQDFFLEQLQCIGNDIEIVQVFVDNNVETDVDFGKVYGGKINRHSYSIAARMPGRGGEHARSLLLQSHMDVVPADAWPEAFTAAYDGQRVWGRGSCDAKGQLVTLWLVLKVLKALGVSLAGDLLIQSVVEEEIGGNGTLDLILKGYLADAVVVLEPTELRVHPSHRGCITFEYKLTGEPVHMGQEQAGISAIDQVLELIGLLKAYKERLLNLARSHPLYADHPGPVQLNIGIIHAGEWPGTLAESAVVVGDIGFPPNISIGQVKHDLYAYIADSASQRLKDRYTLAFVGLHNDAYETAPDHPFIETLVRHNTYSPDGAGLLGLGVSCDARLYAKRANRPTAIFGPGSLSVAHSNREHIQLGQILQAAEVLIGTVLDWCQVRD